MKLKTPKPNANFWIIGGTLAFFILSYFFYLKSFVPNQESKIISTRFRVLDQMGDNIQNKIESYDKDVIKLQLINKIQDTITSLEQLFQEYGYSFPQEQIVAYILENCKQGKYKEFLNKDIQISDYKLDNGGTQDSNNTALKNNELIKTETDKYFYFKPLPIITTSTENGFTQTFSDSVLVRVSYENILNGLIRDDVFDGMFMIRNGEFIFSTLKSDMLVDKSAMTEDIFKLLFTNPEISKPAGSEESGKSGPKLSLFDHISSGEYSQITISNKDYKLFFKPIKVEGEYWFLGGLMEVGHFDVAGRSIPQRVIILIFLALILIVLGLPLFKLKIISKLERLKTGSIINSALAILLGTSVLTFFLLYLSQNTLRLQNADKRLIKFSDAIDSTFSEELDNAYKQLTKFDQSYESFDFEGSAQWNEDHIIPNILNLPEDNIAFPTIYPFADYFFWVKKDGDQSAYLTPFKEKSLMAYVGYRDYFNKKDEWFFPHDSTIKFRLESILSNTTGDHKLAIATSSIVRNNPVIAITSKFYSLFDPILPKSFGYCIIDEGGKVWFHSDKYRNLMENFIDECNNNDNLNAAIYSNTPALINITYYNKTNRAFIKPLDKLPLYLITFYNWDTETSFQAQVFTLALIFIGMFFMFIFLQIVILLILERRLQGKLTKNLLIQITRPMAHLKEHYRFLIRVYLIIAIVTAIAIHFVGKVQSFALIYMVEIIIFSFSYRVINDNELKKNQSKWFTRINYFLLILMNVVLFIFTGIIIGLILIGCQILLILLLNKAYQSFKSKLKKPELPGNQNFVRNFIMFLLSQSIIFAILPTMVFYEIAYNKESEIRLRHYQVDLMKKREDRNAKWNKYYAPMLDSPASTEILQDRKNRGIYTDFYYNLAFSQKPIPPVENENDIIRGSVFDSFFSLLRPFYDDEIVEDKLLISGNHNNSQKYWMNYGGNSLVLKYLSNTEDPKFAKQEYMRIAGKAGKFNFLMPYHLESITDLKGFIYNSAFWLIMLLILFIFYHLIRFGVRNIFSLDIVANFSYLPFDKLIQQQFLANKNIFIVKLSQKDDTRAFPGIMPLDLQLNWSDKVIITNSERLIDNCLAEHQSNQKPEAGSGADIENKLTIFIDHFEWGYSKPEILQEKLDILLKFIRHKEIHWIVQSNESPVKMIADYQEIINFNKNIPPDDATTVRVDLALYKKILNDLQQFMNNIIINQLPVKCSYTKGEEEDPCGRPVKKPELQDLIKEELNACDYLGQFEAILYAYYNSNIKGHDLENPEGLIIDKINSLADSYYEDLFNSCSPEEQYVMLDLAEDLIMNQKNSKAIFGLLEKGILVKKCDKIIYMNVSFRRFIIAQKSKLDTSELEAKIGKKAGTWQGYRIMFIVIIVSLFIFISMANQDFLKNLQQIFVVIGGGIAAITGVLGLLSRNKSAAK
jgi:hypothetical protein